jgi:aspartate racemase
MKEPGIAGLIGGMGPEATVDLMRRVIRATPAEDDADHVHMIVDNNPRVPSRIRALIEGDGESPVPCLREMARRLETHGAHFLAIPCNSAHAYFDEIASAVSIPVLHMIRLTVEAVADECPGLRFVGVLASSAVLTTGLYEEAFRRAGVEVLYPRESLQGRIMQAIREIKAGGLGAAGEEAILEAARDLQERGAGALVVACTELSLAAGALAGRDRVYDAAQVLAEAIVDAASGEVRRPSPSGGPAPGSRSRRAPGRPGSS